MAAYMRDIHCDGLGSREKRIANAFRNFSDARDLLISTKVGRVLAPVRTSGLRAVREGFEYPESFESVFDYSYDGVMRSPIPVTA
jgi:D-threo-aldose 1-dehydrogenase